MRPQGLAGQGALLWRIVLVLGMTLLPSLLGAIESPAPVAPASVPAVALSHRARQLMGAVAKGDVEAILSLIHISEPTRPY